jgi:hypothetical protein
MSEDEWNDAIEAKDYKKLNQHLYRIQKCASKD